MPNDTRILLVDDDPDQLRLLAHHLQTAGWQTATAHTGAQALDRLALFRPHLVITDLRMEGMDGMTLAERIRAHVPGLPVIILTAYGTIPEAVAATQRGVQDFLTKPLQPPVLLEKIRDALAQAMPPVGEEGDEAEEWRRALLTRSSAMEDVLERARLIANGDASILIRGASGTGKEVLARAVHRGSARADGPFVAVNCGAIPESLLESELFGHRKGAFTGATSDHQGLVQAAQGGTLLLDEIGDMPLSLQAKLLRFLQERQVRPVGATQGIDVDVRVMSATHRDLAEEMGAGRFREDLYYRLHVVSLELPRLAERSEDIPLLADRFLREVATPDQRVQGFTAEAMERLVSQPWPGNIRQLKNTVEQLVALTNPPLIAGDLVEQTLGQDPMASEGGLPSLAEARQSFERDYLERILRTAEGNVARAARLAQRNRTELYKLLHRHGLDPALFKPSASHFG